jgi:hypothetical protein
MIGKWHLCAEPGALDLILSWSQNRREPSKPPFFVYHNKVPHDLLEFAPL